MAIEIREATETPDREAVFRLRYDTYVLEMGREQEFADRSRSQIEDPWDATATLFGAWDAQELIGTVRYTRRINAPLEHEELYDMDRLRPLYPDRVSMMSKLLVRSDYRKSGVTLQLVAAAYQRARQVGDKLAFINCRPHLFRMYQLMGCRLYRPNIQLPVVGTVIPMVIVLDDADYFREIGSPAYALARNLPGSREATEVLNRAFPEYSQLRPQYTLTQEEVKHRLKCLLDAEPSKSLEIFRGLGEAEVAALLTRFDVLDYEAGSLVFRQSDHSAGLFVVLEGRFEVIRHGDHEYKVVAVFGRGELFGEMGFLGRVHRTASVRSSGPGRLLVLSAFEFEKLTSGSPKVAVKLLQNLFVSVVQRFNEASATRSELWSRIEEMTATRVNAGDHSWAPEHAQQSKP
jgi:CRP-like cAMP-binding protein/GNAT superfamily N-acetyltransferase